MSSLFTNASNIPKVTFLPTKAPAIGHFLWRGYCNHLEIKNLIPAGRSLCKYIWEVIVYIVLTDKKRLKPNIWLEIPQQAESIESIIRII